MSRTDESTHGGPSHPWETTLAAIDGDTRRSDLLERLHSQGLDQSSASDLVDAAIESGELDVGPDGFLSAAGSRHTNLTKCGTPESDGEPDELVSRAKEVAREFRESYPDRASMPLTTRDGARIRRKYAHLEFEEWTAEAATDDPFEDRPSGETRTDVSAARWGEAVGLVAYDYLLTRRTRINLRRGTPGDEQFSTFSVEAQNRWFKSYQKRYFARLNGWLRELTGGTRPSGSDVEGEYSDPHIALITRSASSVPDGDRIGPVELFDRLGDSRRPVYQRLRYDMEQAGFNASEWQYSWVLEPHTSKRGDGRGTNAAYPHEHMVLVVDGELSPSDLRPVLEKHVAKTPGASMTAHQNLACEDHFDGNHWDDADPTCDECQVSVNVRPADEVENVASYVASYASVEPTEFLERSTEYIAFAAAASASNRRTFQQSDPAAWAADADACQQRYESEKSEQSAAHGENLRRSQKGSNSLECAACGSPHGIDQDQTLVSNRLDSPNSEVSADGGYDIPDRESNLKERWSDAERAAVVGESPERTRHRRHVRDFLDSDRESIGAWWADHGDGPPPSNPEQLIAEIRHPEYEPSVPTGFDDRTPEWHLHSVTVDGETHLASGGGVEMVEVKNLEQRLRDGLDLNPQTRYRCDCGVAVYGSRMAVHLLTHDVTNSSRAEQLFHVDS